MQPALASKIKIKTEKKRKENGEKEVKMCTLDLQRSPTSQYRHSRNSKDVKLDLQLKTVARLDNGGKSRTSGRHLSMMRGGACMYYLT